MARANDPKDDKTMRRPRPDLDFEGEKTMRMPRPDQHDEKTVRVPRRNVEVEKTVRVPRPQDDWEPTVRAPLPDRHDPGSVSLPLERLRHEPTVRMPRPGSHATVSGKAAWSSAAPAPQAVPAGALREMPKLPPAPPPSRKLLWVGLGLAVVVLAVVAGMVIRF